MFATLAGGYPAGRRSAPLPSGPVADRLVRRVLGIQARAGLGLLSDGSVRMRDPVAGIGARLGATVPGGGIHWPGPMTVEGWAFAAEAAGPAPVKQCLPGPYTLGRRLDPGGGVRPDLTRALAEALALELAALAEAGCPFIQVDEDDAVAIGADATDRALFRDAHHRLLAALPPAGAGAGPGARRPHLSLAVSGGSADGAGPETIFAAPYDSHFFDLIAGPDNWRLVTRAPAGRGIVCGVADARSPEPDPLDVMIWAVGYAASSGGRGEARVGVAPSGSLAGLTATAARRKLERLGEVVRLVEGRAEAAIAATLDPRSVDARSAGLGRWTPRRDRPAG